ncbi:hypothetical protein IB238_07730 [Rhizobium sp. ARZ01]|uniref:hypothetical protein n=1 Tax=Rhizobium sp. ARZ01 TaxID=2769313 RepID=UPI001785A80C|nr:hypothetical protein [Rhizobium sp. ARZ01]MBD9372507.1 hypothetical protein [Rhizobium sp. ARZ01]
MLMSFLRVPLAALAVLAMSVAAGAETLKDVRKVSVGGDGSVSPAVVKMVGQQLKQAVRSTRRPVSLPKVTMDVRLSNAVRGLGTQAGRNSAQVAVVLRDRAGIPVSSEEFTVNSFMVGAKAGDKALAKAISQRVAHAYRLAPVKAATADGRPGKRQTPRSTSHSNKPSAGASVASRVEEPVIIPSEAALTVRPRVRKPKVEANASAETKPAPCVVTATTNCN